MGNKLIFNKCFWSFIKALGRITATNFNWMKMSIC